MLEGIVKNWWVFALRGVLAIVFGVLAFVRPDITLVALVALFGVYALLDGFFAIIAAPLMTGSPLFLWVLLDGLFGIAAGIFTFAYPHAATAVLLSLLAVWLIVAGVFRIVVAVELLKGVDDEWMALLGGILSIVAGALTLYRPVQSAVAWMWIIGVYAVLYGVMMVTVGVKMHKLAVTGNAGATVKTAHN